MQQMSELASSRQCTASTLHKVKWHLRLERPRDSSFRRQCKLATANIKWVYCKDNTLKLAKLSNDLSRLMGSLEVLVPGDDTIMRSCCNEEVSLVLREAPPGSPQLSLLKRAMPGLNERLLEAISRREEGVVAGTPQIDERGFI